MTFPMKGNGKRLEIKLPKDRKGQQVLLDGEPFLCRGVSLSATAEGGVSATIDYYPGEVDLFAEIDNIDFKELKLEDLEPKYQTAPRRLKHACHAFVEGFLHPSEFIALAGKLIPVARGLLNSPVRVTAEADAEVLAAAEKLLEKAIEQSPAALTHAFSDAVDRFSVHVNSPSENQARPRPLMKLGDKVDFVINAYETGAYSRDKFLEEATELRDTLLSGLSHTPQATGAFADTAKTLAKLVRSMNRSKYD